MKILCCEGYIKISKALCQHVPSVTLEKKPGCVYEVSLPSEEGTEGEKKVEEGKAEEGEDGEGPPSAVVTVFRFIMKQSYICALIAMMVSRRTGGEEGKKTLFGPGNY